MNGARKRAALRARLFKKQKGLCHWCGLPMNPAPAIVVRGEPEDPMRVTLEHIYERGSPERGTNSGYRNVAAHKKCNNDRSAKPTVPLGPSGRPLLSLKTHSRSRAR